MLNFNYTKEIYDKIVKINFKKLKKYLIMDRQHIEMHVELKLQILSLKNISYQ